MWARWLTFAAVAAIATAQECKNTPKKKNPNDCGEYYLCPLGKPTENHCSLGLAYNKEKGICDWADLVEDCDVEKYLDFECPDASAYDSPGANKAYPHPEDCAKQFVCVPSAFEDYKRVPRLLSCDHPEVFNPEVGKCDYYKEVKGCEKYYENVKKVAPVKEASEIEAGAIPDARVVSRNPTSRPVPEVRRKVARPTTTTSTTTAKPDETEYEDEEQ